MLNNLTDKTEVKAHSERNLTTFTIEVGLHPADIERILDLLCLELKNNCGKTIATIDNLIKEREYLKDTLNIK